MITIPDSDTGEVLTVSELNQRSRALIEQGFANIWVEGEISNFSAPSSGHWYFTLKDESGQLRCAMFRNRNFRVRERPRNGQKVLLNGGLSLYVARGEYQMIVEKLDDTGLGELQRELEALKTKLAQEGLFAAELKRELPVLPRQVIVISSPTGAAIHDFLTVFRRRFPLTSITLIPSKVQGNQAADELVEAVQLANRMGPHLQPPADVIVLTRGGGSLEDLWAFNDEQLARVVRASLLPVVSAVGHETDFSVSDLVADYRAPTPSAAAETLSPDRESLSIHLQQESRKLAISLTRQIQQSSQKLDWLRHRLRHPATILRDQAQRVDELESKLISGIKSYLNATRREHAYLSGRLLQQHPSRRLVLHGQQTAAVKQRLNIAIGHSLAQFKQRLSTAGQLLDTVSPLATLDRGYAIVSKPDGSIIREGQMVKQGQKINARLGKGQLECTVDQVIREPKRGHSK